MSSRNEPVAIPDCTVERESESAILVRISGVATVWIPKSQIHDDSEVYESGTEGTLVIPEWLAVEKGIV